MSRRILYLQYTNPAGYPPLMHSATLLAEQGWDIRLVGISATGTASLTLPEHPRIAYKQLGGQSGGSLSDVKYAAFALRVLNEAARFRPQWCYASDALSTPVALTLRDIVGVRMLYHEHDFPHGSAARGVIRHARNQLARIAEIVIAPAAQRLELIPAGTGRRIVVWNCPRRSEVAPAATPRNDYFRLVYQGSLSAERLTPQLIDALALLPERVTLDIYGYETAGHRGYVKNLLAHAQRAGVAQRVQQHAVIPARADLLRTLQGHHLGVATVALDSTDRNLSTLAGASNKAFEYLAAGMPLLISRDPVWQAMYGEYAVDCLPNDAVSIADAIRSLLNQPDRAHAMGLRGQQRILADWNYETQFAPVMQLLSA